MKCKILKEQFHSPCPSYLGTVLQLWNAFPSFYLIYTQSFARCSCYCVLRLISKPFCWFALVDLLNYVLSCLLACDLTYWLTMKLVSCKNLSKTLHFVRKKILRVRWNSWRINYCIMYESFRNTKPPWGNMLQFFFSW